MSRKPHGDPFETVINEEWERILRQREVRGYAGDGEKRLGIALSGGGIRSAAFALGVLQALERYDELRKFDYLSTVSGGGYIGSALTWAYARDRLAKLPQAFPFGSRYQSLRATAPVRGGAYVAERDNVAFIRQHGRYLIPTRQLDGFSLVAMILRTALVTSSVYFAMLLAFLVWLVHNHDQFTAWLKATPIGQHVASTFVPGFAVGLLFVVISVLLAWATWACVRFWPDSAWQYNLRLQAQTFLGRCLALTLGLFAVGAVPHLHAALSQKWSVSVTSLIGGAGVVFEFVRQHRPGLAAAWPRLSNTAVALAALALIYSLLMLAYASALLLAGAHATLSIAVLVAYALLVGFFNNTNLSGVHRMYRDRLTEAFLPGTSAVRNRRWAPALEADVGFLRDVNTAADPGPYHLVNAHVILGGSAYAYLRGRGGDNFIFSSLYCGAESIGWHSTAKVCGGNMTLATAMAISGAAINPNAGATGRGPTRNPLTSFMLALFNVRLGYWIANPHAPRFLGRLVSSLWPNLLYPGVLQGLLGRGHHTRAGYLELSDGGHFDNTGLYELIRRQLDVIVLSLASADPRSAYEDLAEVVERVRVDFGAFISFHDLFASAAPGAAKAPAGIAAALQLSQVGHGVGTIDYGGRKKGTLIVLKSSILLDLPLDTLRYAGAHGDFPNESTGDQFFDERQFEAYREAGYAVCRGMVVANRSPPGAAAALSTPMPAAGPGQWF